MTPVTPAFDATSLIIAGIALAFGLLLLVVGIRGRRIGSEPRCRKCGYDLTGAASENCSECGATINQRAIVHGTRRRRPVMIVVSLLIVAAAGTFGGIDGYRQLQKVDKYRYYPFSWLIDGGHAGDLAALKELDRRLRADMLSNEQLQRVIADALAEQAIVPSTAPPVTQAWVNMLELLCQANKLADAQQRQYFEQFYTYELIVRPQVRAGEPIPYALRTTCAGPDFRVTPTDKGRTTTTEQWNLGVTRLDEPDSISIRPLQRTSFGRSVRTGRHQVQGPYKSRQTIRYPDDFAPGIYELAFDLTEETFDSQETQVHSGRQHLDRDYGAPVNTRSLQFSAKFEVIPADAPDTVELVDDPSLADQIRAALKFDSITCSADQSAQRKPFLQITWYSGWPSPSAPTLPIDVAFDMIVRLESGDWPVHKFLLSAGSDYRYHLTVNVAPTDVDNVTVILRPNPSAARETVDIFRIWGGELILENVTVKHDGQ